MNDLRKIFGPYTEIEASYEVYAQATYYPDHVRIFVPKNPFHKLTPGMERINKIFPIKKEPTEDDLERSIRRTRKKVRDYALCNRFNLFATFTFKSHRQDITRCKSRMSNWLKNQAKRTGKFEYLIVPEFHKDNVSIHFHALLKDYRGYLKPAINPYTQSVIEGSYNLPSYQSGFSEVKMIANTPESHSKVGYYISKYITKDMPLFFGKNRYWASRVLMLPPTQDNPPTWYKRLKAVKTYENDFGLTMEFLNSTVTDAGIEIPTSGGELR